jgi:hypothetical protein
MWILIYTETNDIRTNGHLNEGATQNMFYFPILVFIGFALTALPAAQLATL